MVRRLKMLYDRHKRRQAEYQLELMNDKITELEAQVTGMDGLIQSYGVRICQLRVEMAKLGDEADQLLYSSRAAFPEVARTAMLGIARLRDRLWEAGGKKSELKQALGSPLEKK